MKIKRIMNNYPVHAGVFFGLSCVVLVICLIIFIPTEGEAIVTCVAVDCILGPILVMILDYFKGIKTQRSQRISGNKSFVN